MVKISLCLAGIRTHYWRSLYESCKDSCSRYSWELVICSPFNLPEDMKDLENVKHFQDYGTQCRATQIALSECSGEIVTFPVDDGIYLPDALNQTIDLLESKRKIDGIVVRYKEGSGYLSNPEFAVSFNESYWEARNHLPGVLPDNFKIAPMPMFYTEYLKDIGGFDAITYECCSFACWSLSQRTQLNGSELFLSPVDVVLADNYGSVGKDHSVIFHAHTPDYQKFIESSKNPIIKIDLDNWKKSPSVWSRRFKKLYRSYDEMIQDQ